MQVSLFTYRICNNECPLWNEIIQKSYRLTSACTFIDVRVRDGYQKHENQWKTFCHRNQVHKISINKIRHPFYKHLSASMSPTLRHRWVYILKWQLSSALLTRDSKGLKYSGVFVICNSYQIKMFIKSNLETPEWSLDIYDLL